MDDARYIALVDSLRRQPAEANWFEFKVNNSDPETIGTLISAISNSATLGNEPSGYVVWGVENSTHSVVGTDFVPAKATKGNQPLVFWLSRCLKPSVNFNFYNVDIEGRRVVVLQILGNRR